MTYLLDLNALLALAFIGHSQHATAFSWRDALPDGTHLATCSITENGLVRVAVQSRATPDVATTRKIFAAYKRAEKIMLLAGDVGVDARPAHVRGPNQITDGHLLALAQRHGAKLATLDAAIPGAVHL